MHFSSRLIQVIFVQALGLGIAFLPTIAVAESSRVTSGNLELFYQDGISKTTATNVIDWMVQPPVDKIFGSVPVSLVLVKSDDGFAIRAPAGDHMTRKNFGSDANLELYLRVLSDDHLGGQRCDLEYWRNGKKIGGMQPSASQGKMYRLNENKHLIFCSGQTDRGDAEKMSLSLTQLFPQALAKIHRDENGLSLGIAVGLREYPLDQWNPFGATVAKAISELFPGETATFRVLDRGLLPVADANLSWTYPEKSDDDQRSDELELANTSVSSVDIFNNCVYYLDATHREEADNVAQWLIEKGYFHKDSSADVRYLFTEGAHVVQMVLVPRNLDSETVDAFGELGNHMLNDVFNGQPFQFQLCTNEFELIEDHVWSANLN